MADKCWDIIKDLEKLYGEYKVPLKTGRNALLAAKLIENIKKKTIRKNGYWQELKKYHSMDQFQEETVKAQFQLLKKPIQTGFEYMQFIQASINKSKHQELREKVTAIIRNWNTIVDEINSQFPKGNSLKLLLKKDDDLNHFV